MEYLEALGIPRNPVYLFSLFYAWYIAVIVLFEHKKRCSFLTSPYMRLYPIKILEYRFDSLKPVYFHVLMSSIVCILFILPFSPFPRILLLLAAILLYIYFRAVRAMDDLIRIQNHMILILFSLAFIPNWDLPPEVLSSSLYIQIAVLLILSQMYGSSGLQKLKRAGWKWANGSSLKYYLLTRYLMYNDEQALWLSNRNIYVLKFLSVTVLFFELTFILTLFLPKLLFIYLSLGFIFHLGTYFFMRINYLRFVIISYIGLLLISLNECLS